MRFIPLALAFIGFLFGFFWTNFSSLVRPFFSGISNSLTQLETISQSHPIESGLVFAVIGALIMPVTTWIRNITLLLLDRPTILDLIFKEEDHVHAVVSHMRQESFKRIGVNQEIRLPKNALFLPSSVAMSIALLSDYCQNRYGGQKTAMFHYDHDSWGARDHNFFCVGGPFVNQTVKSILESTKIPDFTIDDIPTALDQGDRFLAERENASTDADAPIVKDYGFIIYMQSLWNPGKKICVLFGLWPQGTQAAVETILGHGSKSTLFKQFYGALKEGRNAIGVVQVTVTGLLQGKAELVKVRTF